MAEIRVPTLGESVTEATIGKWFKQPGDAVTVDEPLVELETDKVTIEVPAPAAGVLSDIAAKDGDTVAVGALLGQIKEGAGAPAAKPAVAPTGQPQQKTSTTTPIGAADEEPQPRVPPKADAAPNPRPSRGGRSCRSRPRCARSRRKPAWSRRRCPAPARTAASPRAT